MNLQMKINFGVQVIEEYEIQTTACGQAIAGSSLATESIKGKTSRKRWPSRTRISPVSSAFPRAILFDARRWSGIGGSLHLVGIPISWLIIQ